MLSRLLTSVIISLLLISSGLFAIEDAYHRDLRQQLLTDYQLSGGEWVLAEDEISAINLIQPTKVTPIVRNHSGPELFKKAVLLASSRGTNPWDAAVRFPTQKAIAKGDKLLLVVWVKGISGEKHFGRIDHVFEKTSSPYDKSLQIGQSPANEWQQWLLPFEAAIDHPTGQARYQINMGYQQQSIEIGGLAILNYKKQYVLSQLPRSKWDLDYAGRELDAPWRADAQQRIEKHRTGHLQIRIVDRNGLALPNVALEVRLKRHQFGFGTAVAFNRWQGTSEDSKKYREKLENLNGDGQSFSIIVPENALKWPTWENPNWEGTPSQVAGMVKWFRERNIRVRGHNLVWPYWQYLPADMEQNKNNPSYLRQRIKDHIFEILGYPGIQGMLQDWDVVNEAAHPNDFSNLFEGDQIFSDIFQWAAQGDPNTQLVLNEYSIISNGGDDQTTQERLKKLTQSIWIGGGRVDAIGIQGHMGYPLTAPTRVWEIFQDFSQIVPNLLITEYDASGVDEETAADYIRDLMTIAFSHPACSGFLMWGFWDGAHWHSDAPIFRKDWSLKPSGRRFLDMVFKEWSTQVEGLSNDAGEWGIQGFYGLYEITLRHGDVVQTEWLQHVANGQVQEIEFDHSASGMNSVLHLDHFELQQNYPNPFNAETRIAYTLPVSSHVRIEILNAAGHRIIVLEEGFKHSGHHEIDFAADVLPSGVYFYKINANGINKMKKMLLLR